MFDFFNTIIGYIEMAWEYFTNLIATIVFACQMITASLTFPRMLVGVVPAVVGAAILIFIAVYVVKFFIGR